MSLSITDLNINSVSRLPTSETLSYVPVKVGTEFPQISVTRVEQRDIGNITFIEKFDRHVMLTYETNPPNIVLSAGSVTVVNSGIETRQDTTNTKLDTLITQTDTIEANQLVVTTKLDSLTATLKPSSTAVVYVCAAVTGPTVITLAEGNVNRKGLILFNDTDSVMFAKFGASASSSSFTVRLPVFATYEMPFNYYSGIVTGVWNTAGIPTGNVLITEIL